MDNAKQQIVERIRQANNVLVTVSANPSVDQLAACIGLTLMLNKMDKHATAVFSGKIPSTIEFLEPEQTLEKTTDSLRDFIIALDKSKADKLRYKVEDKVVKIFITPYRASINEKDLEFSQGDFNVDVVVALGVREQADLDQAITAHGRILHGATIATISTTVPSTLGAINWQVSGASSLSESVTSLSDELGAEILDGQIATALLTGIVAETQRFSNEKTMPQTMNASAKLMAAGANQQLVATKLEPPTPPPPPPPKPPTPATPPPQPQPPAGPPAPEAPEASKTVDGTLEISHEDQEHPNESPSDDETPVDAMADKQIHIDEQGTLHRLSEEEMKASTMPGNAKPPFSSVSGGSPLVLQPPTFSSTLTSETTPEALDPAIDALSLPKVEHDMLKHDSPAADSSQTPPLPKSSDIASPDAVTQDQTEKTLSQIEQDVNSPHARESYGASNGTDATSRQPDIDNLRDAVKAAAGEESWSPRADLGAQYAFDALHPDNEAEAAPDDIPVTPPPTADVVLNPGAHEIMPKDSPGDQPMGFPQPPDLKPSVLNQPMPVAQPASPSAPPVPPPIFPMPPSTGPQQ